MDEVKTTQPTKKSKSKKLIIVTLAVVLVAAVVASYYWRNRDEGKANDGTQQNEAAPAPNGELTETQATEIKSRYEQTKQALKDLDGKSATDRRTLYSSAAFDGAQLNDPEAKNYAIEALKLVEAETNKEENKDFAGYLDILKEISKGNYKPAQGVVNVDEVEQPQQ